MACQASMLIQHENGRCLIEEKIKLLQVIKVSA
jgi:hypothetical protein